MSGLSGVFEPQQVDVSQFGVNSWGLFPSVSSVWAVGSLEVLHLPAVATVGSRAMTPLGRAVVGYTVTALASGSAAALVSGGAAGVDRCAVGAALELSVPQVVWLADGIAGVTGVPLWREVLAAGGVVVSLHGPDVSSASPDAGGVRARLARRSTALPAACSLLVPAEAAWVSGSMHAVRSALTVGVPTVVPRPKPQVRSSSAEGLRRLCWPQSHEQLRQWGLPSPAATRFAGRLLPSVVCRDGDELQLAVRSLLALAPRSQPGPVPEPT